MGKSQNSKKQENNDVYEWIAHLQENPTDEVIQEKIVGTYNNLVHALARKYSKNSLIHEDLVQVGMIGLLGAISRFDPEFKRSFESFAIPTIIGEIKRYLRDQTWSVHVPRRIKELGPQIKRAVDELTIMNQKSPNVQEISEHLDVSEEDVLESMEMGRSYQALSVDRKVEADSEGGTVSILDLIGNTDNDYEAVDQKMLLEKILPILSEQEQQILKCTFFENLSQKETGDLLGISQMHVSRLQRRSLKKLREAIPLEMMEVFD